MYNPMTTEYVRELLPQLSPVRQAFLEAVDYFAYQSTSPIESRLGEYAKDKYDRDALVNAVSRSIRKMTIDEGSRFRLDGVQLAQAIAAVGLPPNTINDVEKAVEEAAIQIIDNATDVSGGKQRFVMGNAHHGRQYIAAAVSENMARNYNF